MSGAGTIATEVDVEAVVAAVAKAIVTKDRPVHLHEPRFAGRERDYVDECIATGWVSSAGRFVDEFESRLAEACGTRAAIAVVNGTAALHVALHLAGVGAGDEVIVPAITFVATANAVTYCGAVPHFVDIEGRHLGLDVAKLKAYLARITEMKNGVCVNRKTGRAIRAVVPVHVFGHPVDMDALNAVCEPFGLPVIEDATESLGSTYRGRPCGSLSRIGVLSFNGNKIVTTGGGGALLTNDAGLARRAKHLTTTAKIAHRWDFVHDEVGWNYRLPNINAALGLAQLEQLDGFVAAKRRLAGRYIAAFANVRGVTPIVEPERAVSNYWLNAVLLGDDSGAGRDAVLKETHAAGLLTRPLWTPMHRLAMFESCPRDDLTVSESVARRLVNLPSSAVLGMQ
ncbi:MAG TPA: LegC family aminotransferase [Pseudolabrys sp.]|nr:LegC family aminotransferase [Pseudolabrys sp.]